jgi:hypothetical protein
MRTDLLSSGIFEIFDGKLELSEHKKKKSNHIKYYELDPLK